MDGFTVTRELPAEFGGAGACRSPHGGHAGLEIAVVLPPGFPEKDRDAAIQAAEGCSVKKAIAAQPTFVVRAVGT